MATGNGSATLRRYRLRDDCGRWLADVVIADDGYFSTVSDYGNYAFWWSAAGACFRSFLMVLEEDYLCSKLGRADHYYGQETERKIRRFILDERRRRNIAAEDARHEWALLKDFDLDRREGFALWWNATDLQDAHELAEYGHEPDLRAFAAKVWPAFARMLRAELAAESSAA